MAIATERAPFDEPSDSRERLRWLGLLRWWALGGAMGGTVVALALGWTFLSPPGLTGGVIVGVVLNALLTWRLRTGAPIGPLELPLHATLDLVLLTWLLAFSGGLTNPLSSAFSFHVVLGALLAGRLGALSATAVSSACVLLLLSLEQFGLLPVPPLERAPPLLWFCALALLLLGLTYFALVLADRLRQERHRAVEQQQEAVMNLRLLLTSLDALKVGLELVDEQGDVVLQNRFAETIRATPPTPEGRPEPIGGSNVRLALKNEAGQRIVDRLALSSGGSSPLGAYLYVDRTEEVLVEQRHVMLERLATLGRALQGVAHELNTPLMTMQTLARDLESTLPSLTLGESARRDVTESLQLIMEQSRRCRSLTQSLLSTAQERSWPEQAEGLTWLAVAERALQLVGSPAEKGIVALDEASLQRPLRHNGDRVLQVLMNLVQNALLALEEHPPRRGRGARITVRATDDDGGLTLIVEDDGPGLPDEVRARLFEPFVTTRPTGQGTGLGLYVCQAIAQELEGELSLRDRPDGGTRAELHLPKRRSTGDDDSANEVRGSEGDAA
ncbi:MAG: sensor histidine kinase [Myxococcota bacterium]